MEPSRKKKKRGPFVALYHDVMKTPAWRAISRDARAIYVEVRASYRGNNNGDLSCTVTRMKECGIALSPTSLAKYLRELVAVGLLVKTRATGGQTHGGKECNLYAFGDEFINESPKHDCGPKPATMGYREFKSVAEAKAAIDLAHEQAKRENHFNSAANKKAKVQNLDGTNSDSGLPLSNNWIGREKAHSKNERAKVQANLAKARAAQGVSGFSAVTINLQEAHS